MNANVGESLTCWQCHREVPGNNPERCPACRAKLVVEPLPESTPTGKTAGRLLDRNRRLRGAPRAERIPVRTTSSWYVVMIGIALAVLGGSTIVMALAVAYVLQEPPGPVNVPVVYLGLVFMAIGGGVAHLGRPSAEGKG
jgi:hypothetical protein